MQTYLFVTTPDYPPERVETEDYWWSCSSTAEEGDPVLVYLTGTGILYEWEILTPAKRHPEWRFVCLVRHVRSIDPPITIKEIRESATRSEWGAPHTNFRGLRSVRIPELVVGRLRALRTQKRGT